MTNPFFTFFVCGFVEATPPMAANLAWRCLDHNGTDSPVLNILDKKIKENKINRGILPLSLVYETFPVCFCFIFMLSYLAASLCVLVTAPESTPFNALVSE